ncbi:MAG: cobyric acid synthase, partial [Candidatus Baltobacteraceae bacterium]
RILGVCGGMQMLGRRIDDPHGVEAGGTHAALAMLPLSTVMLREKTTLAVRGMHAATGEPVGGYEIHVGATSYESQSLPFAEIDDGKAATRRRDGACSADGRITGTYLHGIFDDDTFRHRYLERLRAARGLGELSDRRFVARERERSLDELADVVERELDLASFFSLRNLHGTKEGLKREPQRR